MSQTTPSYDPSFVNLHQALSAWFLGPQAENADVLKELFSQIVDNHARARLAYHPEDGAFISAQIKQSPAFEHAAANLRREFTKLTELLNEKSIPFYSPRYAGHMAFECSLPSILGWLAAMLFNPNNVAFEASPITTLLELDAGMQLCDMIGYPRAGLVQPWGHIACDGTVANLESMCAARNLKFYPLALREAMHPRGPLSFIADKFEIHKCDTLYQTSLFYELDTWELLNLRPEEILSIPCRLNTEYGISSTFLEKALQPFLIQSCGKDVYEANYDIKDPIQYLTSSTKHYSWPKAAAIAGIGSNNVVNVAVDENARMDMAALRKALERSLNKKQAIFAVVAIIGSTEEGAVDPLDEIVELRKEFQAQGLSFIIHADAAWGGYFASMLRDKPLHHTADGVPAPPTGEVPARTHVPALSMLKEYTLRQLDALNESDSITIDPHKSGYCTYPAGGLCYRDGRLRYMVTWTAPYVHQGNNGESIGIYGVEGSKPGASAASVYLHHTVVGLHREGHGSLLGEVCFGCARISAHWAAMSNSSTPYLVVPLNRLRAEPNEAATEVEKKFITENIIGKSNHDIVNHPDPEVIAEMRALGSDLNINAFACNFRMRSPTDPDVWVVNDDVEEANYLNRCIFDRLSVTHVEDDPLTRPMYITSTVFAPEDYGRCLTTFKRRLGLETDSNQSLFVLRNVVLSPFQAAPDFAGHIAEIFRRTLIEEMEHVIARNTPCPQEHTFIMQGTDKLFLVYRPLFHRENGRQQLILSADMTKDAQWKRYLDDKEAHAHEIFTISIPSTTIEDIVGNTTVDGYMYRRGTIVQHCTLSNIKVIKNRSLVSKWRDREYPESYFPFYLYGTLEEQHIDHMLLKAPNVQLTAQRIELNLDNPLDEEELRNGLLLYILLNEGSMQPFDTNNPPFFFTPGAELQVRIFPDPFTAIGHGPGLAPNFDGGYSFDSLSTGAFQPLSVGTVKLGQDIFVDYTDLNKEDFRPEGRLSSSSTKGAFSEEERVGWRNMVFDRMDKGGSRSGVGKLQLRIPPSATFLDRGQPMDLN
ncbi:PLP-dependent transferase [Pholiota conissans]|uniref:PLP-dependent transferase n=1 Tax=Pholiota conissans TaxID=109636 RepID=A0A9P5Z0Q2_9AGAR|nr:PLP-dependent transferase [Pholiota conissans]